MFDININERTRSVGSSLSSTRAMPTRLVTSWLVLTCAISIIYNVFTIEKEHVTTHAVSWGPKSEALRAMAASLCLGADSFVLVDDSAAECAEVAANCPEVGVVQLPRNNPELYQHVLENAWIFDRPYGASVNSNGTEVDKRRTELYREVADRADSRAKFDGGT